VALKEGKVTASHIL